MTIRIDEWLWEMCRTSENDMFVRFLSDAPVADTVCAVRAVGHELIWNTGVSSADWTSDLAPDLYEYDWAEPTPGGAVITATTHEYFEPLFRAFAERLDRRGWSGVMTGAWTPGQPPISRDGLPYQLGGDEFVVSLQADDLIERGNVVREIGAWLVGRFDQFDFYTNGTVPCGADQLAELIDVAQRLSDYWAVTALNDDTWVNVRFRGGTGPASRTVISFDSLLPRSEQAAEAEGLLRLVGREITSAAVIPRTSRRYLGPPLVDPGTVIAPLPLQVMHRDLATRFLADDRWEVVPLGDRSALVKNRLTSAFETVDVSTPGFERFDDIAIYNSTVVLEQSPQKRRLPALGTRVTGQSPSDPRSTGGEGCGA